MKPGYKQTEVGIIPENWDVCTLGALGPFSKGQGIRKSEATSGEIPCIRYGEIYTHHSDVVRFYNSHISAAVALTSKHLRKGDLLFAGSGETKEEIGKCVAFVDDEDVYAGGDIVVLSPNAGSSVFFGYLLNAPPVANQKASKGQGDAVVHISSRALASVTIPFPPPPEQRAIATALSDVDGLLGGLDRLIAKKGDLKQAAMQQLLTGQTRLPGFHGEWEVKRLGEHIVRLKKTTRPSSAGRAEGAYPFFTNTTKPVDRFLDEADFDTEAIIANTGGEAYFNYYNGSFAAMSDCFVFETKIVTRFLYYFLKSVERAVNDNGFTGSGIKHLDKKYFYQMEVRCPAELPEQTAIASVLTEMDAELAALEQRLEKTRALKQAMMQELLTGRTRLV